MSIFNSRNRKRPLMNFGFWKILQKLHPNIEPYEFSTNLPTWGISLQPKPSKVENFPYHPYLVFCCGDRTKLLIGLNYRWLGEVKNPNLSNLLPFKKSTPKLTGIEMQSLADTFAEAYKIAYSYQHSPILSEEELLSIHKRPIPFYLAQDVVMSLPYFSGMDCSRFYQTDSEQYESFYTDGYNPTAIKHTFGRFKNKIYHEETEGEIDLSKNIKNTLSSYFRFF